MMEEASQAMAGHRSHCPTAVWVQVLCLLDFIQSGFCAVNASLFCNRVNNKIRLARWLGHSRTARKVVISLVPRNLEARRASLSYTLI